MDSKNFRFLIFGDSLKILPKCHQFCRLFSRNESLPTNECGKWCWTFVNLFFVAVKNALWYSIISPCLLINILLSSKTSKNNFVQNHHFHSRIIMIEHVWKIHFWARKWLICYHWTEFHGIYASSFSTIVRYVNVDSPICHQ